MVVAAAFAGVVEAGVDAVPDPAVEVQETDVGRSVIANAMQI